MQNIIAAMSTGAHQRRMSTRAAAATTRITTNQGTQRNPHSSQSKKRSKISPRASKKPPQLWSTHFMARSIQTARGMSMNSGNSNMAEAILP